MKWLAMAAALVLATCNASAQSGGKAVYDGACVGCHGSGVLGAPKPGDAAAWSTRAAAQGGLDGLVKSAIAGTAKGMPPRGGRADLGVPAPVPPARRGRRRAAAERRRWNCLT